MGSHCETTLYVEYKTVLAKGAMTMNMAWLQIRDVFWAEIEPENRLNAVPDYTHSLLNYTV